MGGQALGLHLRGRSALGPGLRALGSERFQPPESFGLPREGPWLLYHSAVSSLPCGKLEKPPRCPRGQGRAGSSCSAGMWDGMGWDGKHE